MYSATSRTFRIFLENLKVNIAFLQHEVLLNCQPYGKILCIVPSRLCARLCELCLFSRDARPRWRRVGAISHRLCRRSKERFVRSIIRRLSSNLGSGRALAHPEDVSSCHYEPTFLFLGTVKFRVFSACFRNILGIQNRGHSSKKHVRLTESLHLHCDKQRHEART